MAGKSSQILPTIQSKQHARYGYSRDPSRRNSDIHWKQKECFLDLCHNGCVVPLVARNSHRIQELRQHQVRHAIDIHTHRSTTRSTNYNGWLSFLWTGYTQMYWQMLIRTGNQNSQEWSRHQSGSQNRHRRQTGFRESTPEFWRFWHTQYLIHRTAQSDDLWRTRKTGPGVKLIFGERAWVL